ncbi:MAG TPA: hypothetical protein PLG41_06310 [Leptospiraceae bacterium]|nr:hypothetical protein [Leptospiraceae bacterium]
MLVKKTKFLLVLLLPIILVNCAKLKDLFYINCSIEITKEEELEFIRLNDNRFIYELRHFQNGRGIYFSKILEENMEFFNLNPDNFIFRSGDIALEIDGCPINEDIIPLSSYHFGKKYLHKIEYLMHFPMKAKSVIRDVTLIRNNAKIKLNIKNLQTVYINDAESKRLAKYQRKRNLEGNWILSIKEDYFIDINIIDHLNTFYYVSIVVSMKELSDNPGYPDRSFFHFFDILLNCDQIANQCDMKRENGIIMSFKLLTEKEMEIIWVNEELIDIPLKTILKRVSNESVPINVKW